MTWTYSGDPTTSDRDEVRFLIGDTDARHPLLSDAEIAYGIAAYPSGGPGYPNYRAAIVLLGGLVGKFSASIDKTVGSLSIRNGQRFEQMKQQLDFLKEAARSGRPAGGPQLGGGGDTVLMSKNGRDWNTQT